MQINEFGNYLKQLREDNDLTLRQVNTLSEVSDSYLSQIETGKRGIPSPEILKKLAPIYNVTYEHFMQKAGYLDNIIQYELEHIVPKTIKILRENKTSINLKDDEKIAKMIKIILGIQ